MSVSISLKNQIMDKIRALSSVQDVYPVVKLNPDGYPAIFVTTNTEEGEFASTAENSRVYTYNCLVVFPLGQDFVPASEAERLDYAEQTIATVVEQIINGIDTDFELESLPTGVTTMFTNAADVEWGYADIEGGVARACNVILRVYTEIIVV